MTTDRLRMVLSMAGLLSVAFSKEKTEDESADMIGVSRQTVHAIENGKYVPSTVLALKIVPGYLASLQGTPHPIISRTGKSLPK